MPSLPLMGAEVVLLGMGAFMQNARTVNSMMAQIGRTSRVLESVSSGAAPLSTSLAGLATTAGVAAAGIVGLGRALSMVKDAATEVLQSSAAYQDQLTFLGAVSDTASGNIFKLSQQQLQMSRTTTTAAADIAVLSEELLKAEVPFNDVTGGALKYANALVIASNGELDAGRAAVTMKIGFDAFKSSGVTYEQVANAINGAAQNSTLSLGNMSDAIKQGGATAARYGLNINEFAAAVALLGQVIPSGTEAGTGLRNMFLQLQKPSKEGKALMNEYGISLHNVDGSTRQFVDILGDLEHAFGPAAIAQGKLTEEQRDYALAAIAGERQQKILSTLIDQGVGSYQRLAEQIANTNGVMATQDLVTATTASKMEMLGNNVNALALAFGQGLDPYINAVVGSILQLVQAIDPTLTGMDSLGQMVGGFLVNAFFGLGEVIGSVVVPIFAYFFDMLGAWAQLFAGVAQVVS
ncbi:MAG: phage tail tape measure protein, partial [Acidobacteria bacterium]